MTVLANNLIDHRKNADEEIRAKTAIRNSFRTVPRVQTSVAENRLQRLKPDPVPFIGPLLAHQLFQRAGAVCRQAFKEVQNSRRDEQGVNIVAAEILRFDRQGG